MTLENENQDIVKVSQKDFDTMWKQIDDAYAEINRLIRERETVIALIKDGRFVEALQELEDK